MGDNDEGVKQGEEVKDMIFRITVKGETGQMSISAPGDGNMYDEPLCFWLLERAKDHVKMSNAAALQKMKSNIITPNQKQPFYRNIIKRK